MKTEAEQDAELHALWEVMVQQVADAAGKTYEEVCADLEAHRGVLTIRFTAQGGEKE